MKTLPEKEKYLRTLIAGWDSVVVAYSGGVDSTVVAKISTEELGERALIAISDSPSLSRRELKQAKVVAGENGFNLHIVHTEEMEEKTYLENPKNRCFYCKNELYLLLSRFVRSGRYRYLLNGANRDDWRDFRPGHRAAENHEVRSPLVETNFGKDDVRNLARKLRLSNWSKPSAPCLASRIPYGTSITLNRLSQVEKTEDFLKSLGLEQVRVRHHGDVARIEVLPEDISVIWENREAVDRRFRESGFRYNTLDLRGFRSGSLNE